MSQEFYRYYQEGSHKEDDALIFRGIYIQNKHTFYFEKDDLATVIDQLQPVELLENVIKGRHVPFGDQKDAQGGLRNDELNLQPLVVNTLLTYNHIIRLRRCFRTNLASNVQYIWNAVACLAQLNNGDKVFTVLLPNELTCEKTSNSFKILFAFAKILTFKFGLEFFEACFIVFFWLGDIWVEEAQLKVLPLFKDEKLQKDIQYGFIRDNHYVDNQNRVVPIMYAYDPSSIEQRLNGFSTVSYRTRLDNLIDGYEDDYQGGLRKDEIAIITEPLRYFIGGEVNSKGHYKRLQNECIKILKESSNFSVAVNLKITLLHVRDNIYWPSYKPINENDIKEDICFNAVSILNNFVHIFIQKFHCVASVAYLLVNEWLNDWRSEINSKQTMPISESRLFLNTDMQLYASPLPLGIGAKVMSQKLDLDWNSNEMDIMSYNYKSPQGHKISAYVTEANSLNYLSGQAAKEVIKGFDSNAFALHTIYGVHPF